MRWLTGEMSLGQRNGAVTEGGACHSFLPGYVCLQHLRFSTPLTFTLPLLLTLPYCRGDRMLTLMVCDSTSGSGGGRQERVLWLSSCQSRELFKRSVLQAGSGLISSVTEQLFEVILQKVLGSFIRFSFSEV